MLWRVMILTYWRDMVLGIWTKLKLHFICFEDRRNIVLCFLQRFEFRDKLLVNSRHFVQNYEENETCTYLFWESKIRQNWNVISACFGDTFTINIYHFCCHRSYCFRDISLWIYWLSAHQHSFQGFRIQVFRCLLKITSLPNDSCLLVCYCSCSYSVYQGITRT